MSTSLPELTFLQQLFEQDTLYVIPEEFKAAAPAAPGLSSAPEAQPAQVAAAATAVAPKITEQAPAPLAAPAPAERAPIEWFGEAVKGTYLLFGVSEQEFKLAPQHVFLQKVLAAVGLTTQQVKFGNLSPAMVHDVKEIAQQQQAQHILLFGQGLPVANLSRLEFYRMYKFENTRFVLVDALEDIEKSVELKKKLWDVLQKIFLQQN
ncbi:hypothetical protein [Rufibacter immobilis]|uniref:hypothetical protein n=1 Tax=Rufibacter immobilis TaxID=1348778 RepID=UPI0035EA0CE2